MNKLRVTKKEMRNNDRVLGVGYCAMQSLLSYEHPIAYSAGDAGWSCDYYYIDDILISAGYQPIKSKNVIKDYDMIKKYEEKVKKVTSLLKNFLKEIKR